MMNDSPAIRQALRDAAYEDALADAVGLNVTDLRAVQLVIGEPGLTPGRLADQLTVTSGAVTGILDRLERAGYVARESDATDRRRVVVRPAAKAAEVTAAASRLDQRITSLLGDFSPAEQRAIARFIEASRTAVDEDVQLLRAEVRGGFVGRSYRAPVASAIRGRLVFASGAPRLALNVAPLGPRASARLIMETSASRLHFDGAASPSDLLRASFEGPLPDVRTADGLATMRYRRKAAAAFTARMARVTLNPGVPWSIELEGGITDLDGTLEGIALDRLEVAGGANHIDLDLPEPTGTAIVRIMGVTSSVRFRRPRGVPISLRVDGGISHLRFDGKAYSMVSGAKRLASTGFAGKTSRYEIEVLGGGSEVEVTTR